MGMAGGYGGGFGGPMQRLQPDPQHLNMRGDMRQPQPSPMQMQQPQQGDFNPLRMQQLKQGMGRQPPMPGRAGPQMPNLMMRTPIQQGGGGNPYASLASFL